MRRVTRSLYRFSRKSGTSIGGGWPSTDYQASWRGALMPGCLIDMMSNHSGEVCATAELASTMSRMDIGTLEWSWSDLKPGETRTSSDRTARWIRTDE